MRRLLLAMLLLVLPSVARAQCAGVTACTAAGVDQASVQNALNSINLDNTTLTVPSGSATWSSAVTYNQSFSTTIKGQSNCTGTGTQTPSCTDSTNITGSEFYFTVNTAANKLMRISGFTFQVGSTFNGLLHLTGTSAQVRIDHNHFLHMQAVGVIDGPTGVIDHNFFDFGTSQSVFNGFRIGHGNWLGDQFGDGSWADSSNFGSLKFMFFEDNTAFNGFIDDCNDGGRFVMRHNYFHDATMQGHEMESRMQGCRAFEAYSNTFFAESAQQSGADTSNSMLFRTGTGLIWGNTTNYNNLVTINNDRSDTSHGFSAASSSCTSGGDPSFNCWGYACNNAFAVGTACDASHSLPNSPSGFDGNTDSFGYPAFDQVGRGKGDLLPQFDNSNIAFWNAGEPAWPHQQLEPLYLWLNTFTPPFGGPYLGSAIGSSLFQQNRDWYTDNAGSQGVRTGTSLPATCTPLQGFWNTSTSTLSQCTSTNTWATLYTPAPYPHPLAGATWAFGQDSLATFCANSTSCTFQAGNVLPTTAGSVWVVEIQATADVSLSSVTGGGATWTHCTTCHIFSSGLGRSIDLWYGIGGSAGTIGSVTATASGTALEFDFIELIPPAGTTPVFDVGGGVAQSSCASNTCTGVGLSLTGTDIVFQTIHAASTGSAMAWSSPYITDYNGSAWAMNITDGTAPTVKITGTSGVLSAIAFKTVASFTPFAQQFTAVNWGWGNGITCSTSCVVTMNAAIGSSHLLYVQHSDAAGGAISSVSGGGSGWVVPSGCHNSASGLSQSCAYLLSSSGGGSTITINMGAGSASRNFFVWEIASTGGTFLFDALAAQSNAASFSPPGPALTVTGSNDVVFEASLVSGGSSSINLYPQTHILGNGTCGGFEYFFCNGQLAMLQNTFSSSVPTPLWVNQQNTATAVTGVAFSSTGPAQNPIVSFSPNPLAFGSRVQGSSLTLTATLTNTGGANLVLSTPYDSITGTNASDFTDTGAGTCANGATIVPAGSCTISVSYVPTSVGAELASLVINANASGSATLTGSSVVVSSVIKGAAVVTGSATIVINP